ncbi:hypothetical protein Dimus_039666 [Dionaea muscipula]
MVDRYCDFYPLTPANPWPTNPDWWREAICPLPTNPWYVEVYVEETACWWPEEHLASVEQMVAEAHVRLKQERQWAAHLVWLEEERQRFQPILEELLRCNEETRQREYIEHVREQEEMATTEREEVIVPKPQFVVSVREEFQVYDAVTHQDDERPAMEMGSRSVTQYVAVASDQPEFGGSVHARARCGGSKMHGARPTKPRSKVNTRSFPFYWGVGRSTIPLDGQLIRPRRWVRSIEWPSSRPPDQGGW